MCTRYRPIVSIIDHFEREWNCCDWKFIFLFCCMNRAQTDPVPDSHRHATRTVFRSVRGNIDEYFICAGSNITSLNRATLVINPCLAGEARDTIWVCTWYDLSMHVLFTNLPVQYRWKRHVRIFWLHRYTDPVKEAVSVRLWTLLAARQAVSTTMFLFYTSLGLRWRLQWWCDLRHGGGPLVFILSTSLHLW